MAIAGDARFSGKLKPDIAVVLEEVKRLPVETCIGPVGQHVRYRLALTEPDIGPD